MISSLQKKFTVTAMIAISVLLLVLLGAINIANMVLISGDLQRTLTMLVDSQTGQYGYAPPAKPYDRPLFFIRPKEEHDTFMSSNFFVVRLDLSGQISNIDVSHIPSVDEDTAKELVESIDGQTKGKLGKYRFEVRQTGTKTVIVFLDTSTEIISYLRVLLLSGGLGLICWTLMLMLVIFLSRRAIRPIAESIEKQKQFVTNAGHEIKTPLAIISANTEAMELYKGENKWTKNIKTQVDRLNGLMKNLLLLSKMEEQTLKYQPFSMSELAKEVADSFSEPFELKGISFKINIQPEIILNANKESIMQLLSILLDNAVKYTNDNGLVTISLCKEEKNIKIKVENTCDKLPDVPPEKLFDRFYRADEARTQKNGGYGIGLSVAQAIVKSHLGTITAHYIVPDVIYFDIIFKV